MILEKFQRYFFMFSHTDVHKVLTLKQSLPGIDPKSVQKQYKLLSMCTQNVQGC